MLLASLLALLLPQEFLTGLDGFSIENLGADVAAIGDVDGDGRDDFLAANATIAGPSDVRLISGRTRAVLLQVTPPGQLPPPPVGPYATSANTLRVVGAGDVDGDGAPDFLVSNQNEAVAGAADAGTVRVYSSKDGALIHELFGPGAGARFGAAIDAGLDVDGDGRPDFLVGAPGDGLSGVAGRAWLYSGANASVLYTFGDSVPNGMFGHSVALTADVSRDFGPDLAIGVPRSNNLTAGGRVELYSGSTGGLFRTFIGSGAGDQFGVAIDGIGDLDGDGLAELVIGSPGVILGPGVQVLSGATGAVLVQVTKAAALLPGLGRDVVALGDADGDGVPDFAASGDQLKAGAWSGATGARIGTFSDESNISPFNFTARSLAGGLDVNMDGLGDVLTGVTGKQSYAHVFGLAPGPRAWHGEQGLYAHGIAVMGDVDGDGCDDFAVAEPGDLNSFGFGRIEVRSGRDGTQLYEKLGSLTERTLGFSLAALDDLDGDGVPELATTTSNSPGGERLLVFSPPTGRLVHDIALGQGALAPELTAGGDADGDGVADLLVPLPYRIYSSGAPASVRVFSGATGAALPGYSSSSATALFGFGATWIGDVDGDDRDDWATTEFIPSGSPEPPAQILVISGGDGTLLRTITGTTPSGIGLGGVVEDLDGDGVPDLLASSQVLVAGQPRGVVQILSSASGAVLRTHLGNETDATGQPMSPGAAGAVRDMDGDGRDDYAMTSYSLGEPRRVHVFSHATGRPLATFASRDLNDNFGYPLRGLDADGDGQGDLLVGASYSGGPNGATNGMVYVLRRSDASVVTYCPPSPSSNNCRASVSTSGTASIAHGSPFEVRVTQVEGARSGFLFWSNQASSLPFAGGPLLRCVGAPAVRLGPLDAGGTVGECDGVMSLDFAAWARQHPRKAPVPGTPIHLQAWFGDPTSSTGAGLSDAVEFSLQP